MTLRDDYFLNLDFIVNQIETSFFNELKRKLVEPIKNVYLVKTLHAILMLLSINNDYDSYIYNVLSNRIKSVDLLIELEPEINLEEDKEIMKEVNYYIEIF